MNRKKLQGKASKAGDPGEAVKTGKAEKAGG
jgi:hypothetical protein